MKKGGIKVGSSKAPGGVAKVAGALKKKNKEKNKLTPCEAFMHLLKTNIGPGILAAPSAFSKCGIFAGVVFTAALAVFSFITNYQLMTSSRHLCKKLRKRDGLEYPELAEQSFLNGSPLAQNYSKVFKFTVAANLLLNLLGNCAVYILFAANMFKVVADDYLEYETDIKAYIIFLLFVLMLLNVVRDLYHLTPFCIIALGLQTQALVITLYSLSLDAPPVEKRPSLAADFKSMSLFLGIMTYAVQQPCAALLSIECKMRNPRSLTVFPFGVIFLTMIFSFLCVSVIGFAGFVKYEDPQPSITFNMPSFTGSSQTINVVFAIGIILSYPILFNVCFGTLWRLFGSMVSQAPDNMDSCEYIFRAVVVSLAAIVAGTLPLLEPLLSVVGSVVISPLGLIFPPLIHLQAFHDVAKARVGFDYVLIAFGAIIFCVSASASISDMATQIENGNLDRYYYQDY